MNNSFFFTSQGGVESQFSHWNAHSLGAQIAQTQNPLSVGDHDGSDVILWPVLQDVVDVAFIMDGNKQALKVKKEGLNFKLIINNI